MEIETQYKKLTKARLFLEEKRNDQSHEGRCGCHMSLQCSDLGWAAFSSPEFHRG